LIYAKDDSHADDIVQIVREEFGKGNDFAQKITYKTTGVKTEDLIASFRNSYNPRIVVTVDMIATGTDIKPLEIVMFMRAVKSRNFFEQMKGRGVRIINDTDFQVVTGDAKSKTHFVIVDCVGVCEQKLTDSWPLERKPTVSFEKLLQAIAFGSTDPDILSSLAGRLARLDRQLGEPEKKIITQKTGGISLKTIVSGMIEALDPDQQVFTARLEGGLTDQAEPSPVQLEQASEKLIQNAVAPIAGNPELRNLLIEMKKSIEQTIDTVSKDVVLESAFSEAAKERARGLVASFEKFLQENKDEITALQLLYSQPYSKRLRFDDIKGLAEAIKTPPRSWTPEALWRAYETLDQSKVRGSGGQMLTDIVSLVRFALHQENELVPYEDQVDERFKNWLAQQENKGRQFTDEQRQWVYLIKDHIVSNLKVELEDFDLSPFIQKGGAGKAYQVFGKNLNEILNEMNEVLAA
jgi:type I restriction enzyme R subunit